jgi:hypothetical protein
VQMHYKFSNSRYRISFEMLYVKDSLRGIVLCSQSRELVSKAHTCIKREVSTVIDLRSCDLRDFSLMRLENIYHSIYVVSVLTLTRLEVQ